MPATTMRATIYTKQEVSLNRADFTEINALYAHTVKEQKTTWL